MEENRIYKEYEQYLNGIDGISKNYIVHRVIDQIIWYDDKAQEKQKAYNNLTITSIILTSCVPILTLFTGYKYGIVVSIIIAILSSASSVILSITNLKEYQKHWVQYRSACEILKSTLHRYFMKASEFCSDNDHDNLQLLCLACEEYMTKEYQTWTKTCNSTEKEK